MQFRCYTSSEHGSMVMVDMPCPVRTKKDHILKPVEPVLHRVASFNLYFHSHLLQDSLCLSQVVCSGVKLRTNNTWVPKTTVFLDSLPSNLPGRYCVEHAKAIVCSLLRSNCSFNSCNI